MSSLLALQQYEPVVLSVLNDTNTRRNLRHVIIHNTDGSVNVPVTIIITIVVVVGIFGIRFCLRSSQNVITTPDSNNRSTPTITESDLTNEVQREVLSRIQKMEENLGRPLAKDEDAAIRQQVLDLYVAQYRDAQIIKDGATTSKQQPEENT
jgi:hypothetical protein